MLWKKNHIDIDPHIIAHCRWFLLRSQRSRLDSGLNYCASFACVRSACTRPSPVVECDYHSHLLVREVLSSMYIFVYIPAKMTSSIRPLKLQSERDFALFVLRKRLFFRSRFVFVNLCTNTLPCLCLMKHTHSTTSRLRYVLWHTI